MQRSLHCVQHCKTRLTHLKVCSNCMALDPDTHTLRTNEGISGIYTLTSCTQGLTKKALGLFCTMTGDYSPPLLMMRLREMSRARCADSAAC